MMSEPMLSVPSDGDVDLRGGFMAGIVLMTVIAIIIAWLRMYVRIFSIKSVWWDDWVMFIAMVRLQAD